MSSDPEKSYYFGFDLTRAEELFEMARLHRAATRGKIDWRGSKGYSPRTLVTACEDDKGELFLTNMPCEHRSTLERAMENSRSVTYTGTGLWRPVTTVLVIDVLNRRPKGWKWETPPHYDEMLACAYGNKRKRLDAYQSLDRLLLSLG